MRILVIRPCNAIGGAEIYNLNLIKGFRKYYPETELIFITTLPEFARRIESEGGQVITLPVFSEEIGTKRGLLKLAWNLPKYLFYYIKTILSINKKKKIDLIWLHSATEKIILTPILKNLRFRVVWLEQGPFFSCSTSSIVFFLYKIVGIFVEKIITVSEDTKLDAERGGLFLQKLICVKTCINETSFSPLSKDVIDQEKAKIKIRGNERLIGYVGGIDVQKGIKDFLEVSEMINRRIRNTKFILVGNGDMVDYVHKYTRKHQLSKNYIMAGFKEDPRGYLGIFDIFLFPTFREGLSLVLSEAMAMGVPVVARDIGGNRELVVHGKTGYLFKNESPEELAEIIIDLLKEEKKRKAMGKTARERIVKHFNMKKWVTELYSVFEEVAKK